MMTQHTPTVPNYQGGPKALSVYRIASNSPGVVAACFVGETRKYSPG